MSKNVDKIMKNIRSKKLEKIIADFPDYTDEQVEREYNSQMAEYCSSGPDEDEYDDNKAQDILSMIRNRHNKNYATDREKFAHYVAGFIDADGSISLAAKGSKDKFRTPCVEFYNNDITILERIQENYGGRIDVRKAQKDTHADSYKLSLTGNQALILIGEVWDKMGHLKKKTRAFLINRWYRECTPRNGKYNDQLLAKKQWLENEVMSIQMRGPEKMVDTA